MRDEEDWPGAGENGQGKMIVRPPSTEGHDLRMLCMYGDVDLILSRLQGTSQRKDTVRSVMDMLIGLALKGYEGRSIGTIYLIGDIEGIRRHSTQMIINPFKGWNDINVMDPEQRPTFESFSQIDGAVVLDQRGYAHYAGRMIHIKGEIENGSRGSQGDTPQKRAKGTRWRAAKFITERTSAVGVILSSSGEITVFERGKEIGRMERRICTFKESEAPVRVHSREEGLS